MIDIRLPAPQISWLPFQLKRDVVDQPMKPPTPTTTSTTSAALEQPKQQQSLFDIKIRGWSVLSILPWSVNSREKYQMPTTINKRLKRSARSQTYSSSSLDQLPPVRFRPYVSKVPWHTGARAFLSQMFPRYGHYCGPNWSSGKDGGSLIWDKRPIDWLDFCCYCHDMGYDTHEQEKLLQADLAFLECLEKPYMPTRGDKNVARLYKTMCVQGLRNVLIPYRTHLLRLQYSSQSLMQFGWLSNFRVKGWNLRAFWKME